MTAWSKRDDIMVQAIRRLLEQGGRGTSNEAQVVSQDCRKIDKRRLNMEMKECRQKYWDECGPEEKIERMRMTVKRLQAQVEELSTMVTRLSVHEHGKVGRPVVAIDLLLSGQRLGLARMDDKDVYF